MSVSEGLEDSDSEYDEDSGPWDRHQQGLSEAINEFVQSSQSQSQESQPLTTQEAHSTDPDFIKFQEVYLNGCKCEKNCLMKIPCHELYAHTLNIKELTPGEKDMYIIGKVMVLEKTDTRSGARKRQSYKYYFKSIPVCKSTFLLAYNIGEYSLKSLLKHLIENGSVPRTHGNTSRRPANALSYEQTENVVTFLNQYALEYGLPMAAPLSGRDALPPVFLPVHLTKKGLHKIYTESCEQSGKEPVGRTSFAEIWKACLPNIKIATPKTDVCTSCEKFREKVSIARTENDKLNATTNYINHLKVADTEHQLYKTCIIKAREEYQETQIQIGRYEPCTNAIYHAHYTFDFSQAVFIPHHTRQAGPLYFLTPRRLQIFGIYNSGKFACKLIFNVISEISMMIIIEKTVYLILINTYLDVYILYKMACLNNFIVHTQLYSTNRNKVYF